MLENNELTIRKANAFVQDYKVSLSLAEIRIVNYLIANIKSPKYDTEFRKFRFDIKEFCDIVYPDKKQGDAYKWLPDVIRKLSDKSAWKEVPSTDNPGKMKKVLIRWIERPEFEEGYVTLELNPYLAPFLLQLEDSFFKSKFQYTVEARSKYTIPLYELLKSWEKVKNNIKRFEVDELRLYMDAMEKSKNNISEFKRRALDPAVKEINEITDLMVSYTEIKRGRKVTHIEFTILHKKKNNSADHIEGEAKDVSNGPDLELPDTEFKEQQTTLFNFAEEKYSEENILFGECMGSEFTDEEVSELVKMVMKKLGIIPFGGLNHDEEMQIYNYLDHYYQSLKMTEIKTKPYYTIRDKILKDYDGIAK